MSDPLVPIITQAGFSEVFNATDSGLEVDITHMALGDSGYAPEDTATALQSEKVRLAIAGGERVAPKQIHLGALADGPQEFWVREIGFITASGVLLAIWSDATTPLAYKSAQVDLLLALDLVVDVLPPNSITVSVGTENFNLSLAPELVQMATAQIDTMRRQLEMDARLRALGG